MSEVQGNLIRTNCILCSEEEISLNLKLQYGETELICKKCNFVDDKIQTEVDKILGEAVVYCRRKCGLRGQFQKIKNHERICNKNILRFFCLLCPDYMSKRFLYLYTAQDLFKHIQEVHSNKLIVLENHPDYKFPLTIQSNTSLMQLQNENCVELYWLQITEKESGVCMFIKHISSLKGDSLDNSMTFKRFSMKSMFCKSITVYGNVIPANTLYISTEDEIFDMTMFKSTDVVITMLDSHAEQIPAEFLSEFDCDICMQVLTIPIKLCNEGHSLCNACYMQVKRCPKCQANLSNARNYALERIVNQINTNCKNQVVGCKVRLKVKDLHNHLSKCQFRTYSCPLCNKSMYYKDITGHAHCLVSGELGVKYLLTMQSPIRFLAFDELFVLHINLPREVNNTFSIAVPTPSSSRAFNFGQSSNPNVAFGSGIFQSPTVSSSAYQELNAPNFIATFCVENFTSSKDIQYYFDLTVSDNIDDKSLTFSDKCGKENVVQISKDYFKAGRELEFILKIYEKFGKEIIANGKEEEKLGKNENEYFIMEFLPRLGICA